MRACAQALLGGATPFQCSSTHVQGTSSWSATRPRQSTSRRPNPSTSALTLPQAGRGRRVEVPPQSPALQVQLTRWRARSASQAFQMQTARLWTRAAAAGGRAWLERQRRATHPCVIRSTSRWQCHQTHVASAGRYWGNG